MGYRGRGLGGDWKSMRFFNKGFRKQNKDQSYCMNNVNGIKIRKVLIARKNRLVHNQKP